MFSDYHVHSGFSFDSEETLDNIITKAISLGMKQRSEERRVGKECRL